MQNFLVENAPTVTLFASGGASAVSAAAISDVQPIKLGWANLNVNPASVYTGLLDTFYRIEIDNAGTGAFGSATWRWTDDPTAIPIVWNASGLTTQNSVYVTLSQGIQVRFTPTGAQTPQFALGDRWDFAVHYAYGYQQGIDGRRDSEFRSGAMPTSSTLEVRLAFASAVQPSAFALLDHNLPSNATVALKAKNTAFTNPPSVTVPVTWNSGRLATLPSTSAFTHWRICFTLGATALTYLRWSEVFLGDSLTFDRTFAVGFQDADEWLTVVQPETLRRGPGPRQLEGRTLRLTYAYLSSADRTRLRTLRTWINDPAFNVQRPFLLLPFDDDLTDLSLYHWVNGFVQDHEFLERYSASVEWAEVVRSVA